MERRLVEGLEMKDRGREREEKRREETTHREFFFVGVRTGCKNAIIINTLNIE